MGKESLPGGGSTIEEGWGDSVWENSGLLVGRTVENTQVRRSERKLKGRLRLCGEAFMLE